MQNKIYSKTLVSGMGCPVPATYQVVDRPEQIDFELLPKEYVIKHNNLNGSRGLVIVDEQNHQRPDEIVQFIQTNCSVSNMHPSERHIEQRVLVEEQW